MSRKKSEVKATFIITKEEFDTEEVTEVLGILPDMVWPRGKYGSEVTFWNYSSGSIEAMDIYEALQNVEAMFEPRTKKLQNLKEKYDLEYSISLVISICDDEVPEVCLRQSTIKFAEEIGADIEVTIYVQPTGIYRYTDKLQEIIWYMQSYTPMALWRRRQRKKLRAKMEGLKNNSKAPQRRGLS